MNQGRVIDHQVLKYKFKTYKYWFTEKGMGGEGYFKKRIENGEEEYFEYLIKVEISKGWTPQGNYNQQGGEYRQTMLKYQGFVTSNPPPRPPPRPTISHQIRTQRDGKNDKVGPTKVGCFFYFCLFVGFIFFLFWFFNNYGW